MSQNDKNERIWKINGLELELDLEDADVFEKTKLRCRCERKNN